MTRISEGFTALPYQTLAEVERMQVQSAMAAFGADLNLVSQALGISKRTLQRKLQRWAEYDQSTSAPDLSENHASKV